MHVFRAPAAHCEQLRNSKSMAMQTGAYRYQQGEYVELRSSDGQVVVAQIAQADRDSMVLTYIGEGPCQTTD